MNSPLNDERVGNQIPEMPPQPPGAPDPERDPSDVATAGRQLRGAREQQGHHQQRDRAPEADAGESGLACAGSW